MNKDLFQRILNGDVNIYLFGAGTLGAATLRFAVDNSIVVSGIYDNDSTKWGTKIGNVPIVSPSEITDLDNNSVIVVTSGYYSDIVSQIRALGITDNILSAMHFTNVAKNVITTGKYLAEATTIERALSWVILNEVDGGGIRQHTNTNAPYKEVTGYIIPTLIDYGMRESAVKLGNWLLSVQYNNGGVTGANTDKVCCFDTAQVLRGFNVLSDLADTFHIGAIKAADFLYKALLSTKNGSFPVSYADSPSCPEEVLLYALPQLVSAGEKYNKPHYIDAAYKCADYYSKQSRFLNLDTLTHFLAYEIEAMIDLGRADEVMPTLIKLAEIQNEDGSVRAYDGVEWVCTPGLAQLAICWYKVGMKETGDKALNWLDSHQELSGGFLGSYGEGANYFQIFEISWAVKYYLDSYRWKIRRFFDAWSVNAATEMPDNNSRLLAVCDKLSKTFKYRHCENLVVADIGCGRGRFLRGIMKRYPNFSYIGVDISERMLEGLPNGVERIRGELENIPLPDKCADFVFCNESVEHSVNLSGAVSELARICKRGGTIAILDKHEGQWGRFNCPSWERWPAADVLVSIMKNYCTEVQCDDVNDEENVDLWKLWVGKKR
jgi:malonyl-CoA O-methyltransferase